MQKLLVNDILTVKDSPVHGKGLFSSIDFFSGQTITAIEGDVIDADECVRRESEGNVYIFWKEDDIYIDVSNHSIIKFINHSCNYNCDVEEDEKGNLILIAIKDIQAGEELTIDYGYDEIYESCTCDGCTNKTIFKSN